jgi:arylsulfatase A-like enzyme
MGVAKLIFGAPDASVARDNRGQAEQPLPRPDAASLLRVAVWFAVVTGLVEGAGLLLFQRINWAQWGHMIHVSPEILWISPLVDLFLFLVLTLLVGSAARVIRRVRANLVLVFLLTFLAVYDWLTLTRRLNRSACALLALGVAVAIQRWVRQHESSALRFWKRTTPWAVGALALVVVCVQGGEWLREESAVANLPVATPGSPNVLVIIVDTLRADHLSSYGYSRPTSPNVDRIAGQGVLFENAISTCSWSLPSHVSLLTGRYVFDHGVSNVLPARWFSVEDASLGGFPTLGEALQRKGYRTGAFSANRAYFSRDLEGRGFLHFEDYFDSAADMFVRTLYGREFAGLYLNRSDRSLVTRLLRGMGFTTLVDHDEEGSGSYGGGFGVRKRAAAVNDEALRWIRRDRERPFFVFLNYFDVHHPYGGPRSYPKPAWKQQSAVDAYDDSVNYVDDYIGRLMHELDRQELLKNTLVVITSDHGESLGQHHLNAHGRMLYRELVHVPLVLWYPGHLPAGIRIARPVTNAAVPATVMDLLGISEPKAFTMPALNPLWKNPEATTNWPDPVSELAQNKYPGKGEGAVEHMVATAKDGPMKSLVTPQWHLIAHKNLGVQLYDWVHDPAESNNLINTPQGRSAALSLTSQLRNMLAKVTPIKRNQRMASAIPLRSGTFDFKPMVREASEQAPVDDYYRLAAKAGAKLTIEVRAESLKTSHRLDPVLAVEDTRGELLQICRDPGDDHIQPPGVADASPDSYDDMCVNDDIEPGQVTDSKLEINVPGSTGSPAELYVRVSDWNGGVGAGSDYRIVVAGVTQDSSPLETSVMQQSTDQAGRGNPNRTARPRKRGRHHEKRR